MSSTSKLSWLRMLRCMCHILVLNRNVLLSAPRPKNWSCPGSTWSPAAGCAQPSMWCMRITCLLFTKFRNLREIKSECELGSLGTDGLQYVIRIHRRLPSDFQPVSKHSVELDTFRSRDENFRERRLIYALGIVSISARFFGRYYYMRRNRNPQRARAPAVAARAHTRSVIARTAQFKHVPFWSWRPESKVLCDYAKPEFLDVIVTN